MNETSHEAVSVVLPAYGEEEAVADEVRAVRAVLAELGRPFEVLVVDDGSSDDTALRARAAGARVIRHAENRGYGAALKTGIRAARHPLIVIKDADGSYPADAIPSLLETLGDADMAVGARIGAEVRIPWVRRPAKWILRALATRVAGKRIPDLNSGLRAFYRDYVEQYLAILPDQFSFTTTITLAYLADGYRVEYVPINYYARVGRSKIRPWHFMDFSMLVMRIAMLFQPLRIFVPAALVFGALGTAKVILDILSFIPRDLPFGWRFFYDEVLSISALLLILIAMQMLAIGMVADAVLRRLAQQRGPLLPSRAIELFELTGEDGERSSIDEVVEA